MQVATPLEGGSTKVNIKTVENNNGLLSNAINTLTSALNKVKEIAEKVKQANNTTSSRSSNTSNSSSSSSSSSGGVSTSLSTSSTRSSNSSSLRNRNSSSSTTQNSSGLRNRSSSSASSGTSTSALAQSGFDEAEEKVLNALNDTKKLLDVGKNASDEYKKAQEEVKEAIGGVKNLDYLFKPIGLNINTPSKIEEDPSVLKYQDAMRISEDNKIPISQVMEDYKNINGEPRIGEICADASTGVTMGDVVSDYIDIKNKKGLSYAVDVINALGWNYPSNYSEYHFNPTDVPTDKIDYARTEIDPNTANNYRVRNENVDINGYTYDIVQVLPTSCHKIEELVYDFNKANIVNTMSTLPDVFLDAGRSGASNCLVLTCDENAMMYKGEQTKKYGGYYRPGSEMVVINTKYAFSGSRYSLVSQDWVIHEYAHKYDDMKNKNGDYYTENSKKWNDLYNENKNKINGIDPGGYDEFPDAQEFFADGMVAYFKSPDALKGVSEEVYNAYTEILGGDYGGSFTNNIGSINPLALEKPKFVYVNAINSVTSDNPIPPISNPDIESDKLGQLESGEPGLLKSNGPSEEIIKPRNNVQSGSSNNESKTGDRYYNSEYIRYDYSNYDKISLVELEDIESVADRIYNMIQEETIKDNLILYSEVDKTQWNMLLDKYNGVLPSGATYRKFDNNQEFFKKMMTIYCQRPDDLKDLYPEIYEMFTKLLGKDNNSIYIKKA